MDFLGIGASLLGGLLGGSDSGSSQTATKSMDPRMDAYVYGSNGMGGLLNSAYKLMGQQLQSGGLNPMQTAGLNMRAQYLQSPQYNKTYNDMASLGSSLMSGGVASNPFTRFNPAMKLSSQSTPYQSSYSAFPVQAQGLDMDQSPLASQASKQIEDAIADYLKKNNIGVYSNGSTSAEGGA